MNALGATILHEIMHYNEVSKAAYDTSDPNIADLENMDPSKDDNYQKGALVWDVTDTNPADARDLTLSKPLQSIKNAENYVWVALESYWTATCAAELQAQQQTRFEPPDAA